MGFKAVITSYGEAALELAHELQPAAITLDLRLPDMDGWVVLDRLKHDPSTRHIPVHVISVDDSWQRGMKLGAFAFLKKPVSKQSLDEAFAGIKGFLERERADAPGRRGQRDRAGQHRGRDRRRRRPDHGRRHGRRGAGGAAGRSRSTAWCSTSACPT